MSERVPIPMELAEKLMWLLDTKMPCGHTLRESITATDDFMRFDQYDDPWICCLQCEKAWPMWISKITVSLDR